MGNLQTAFNSKYQDNYLDTFHFDTTGKAENPFFKNKQKIFKMNNALKIILGIICVMIIISSFQVLAEMGTNSGSLIGFILMVGIGVFGQYKLFLSNSKKD